MKTKRPLIFIGVVALLAAAVALYALLVPNLRVDTPSVILPTPMPAAEGGGSGSGGVVTADVTTETVQAVVAHLSRADSYSRTVTVEDFWDGGSAKTELSVWVRGGATRVRSEAEGRSVLLLADGSAYIWYDDSEDVYSGVWQKGDEDQWLRSITYEELLDVPANAITNAGYAVFNGESCIFAQYRTESFGYHCLMYVSASTGLLTGADIWDGDQLIYRMRSTAPDLSTPDESWFVPPISEAATEAASPQG